MKRIIAAIAVVSALALVAVASASPRVMPISAGKVAIRHFAVGVAHAVASSTGLYPGRVHLSLCGHYGHLRKVGCSVLYDYGHGAFDCRGVAIAYYALGSHILIYAPKSATKCN